VSIEGSYRISVRKSDVTVFELEGNGHPIFLVSDGEPFIEPFPMITTATIKPESPSISFIGGLTILGMFVIARAI
jgi:hypothetical protein